MKGLELSESFYLEYGVPMMKSFSHLEGLVAVGLVGCGSECCGYDDDISHDHDFEPGFCLFLPDEDKVSRRDAFELERAYARLPREFMGFRREKYDPVGGNRHGVIRIGDFLTEKTGSPDGILSNRAWFAIPEQSLLEATNGRIFRDDLGELTAARERLSYFPDDIRLKKLAGNILLAAQTGQYNYGRCVARGETAAAQLAVFDFVKSVAQVIFLLNKRYMPYYKWSFRALRELDLLSHLAPELEYLISSGNGSAESKKKQSIIDGISREIAASLCCGGLSDYQGSELEGHAYSVNSRIADGETRNLHILFGI